MSIAKNNTVTKTQKTNAFVQPIEALENRQMMSASVPHVPAFLPADVQQTNVHANKTHANKGHATQGHGAATGNGTISLIDKVSIVTTGIIYRPFPFFIEPQVNSDVTQWKNFSANPLFAAGGPSPKDVAQGQVGDCWFLATLAEVAQRDPSVITNSIHQRADGTYDVLFHTSPTATINEHIDGKLPENVYGQLEYAKLGQGGCTWVAMMEKAFTYFRNRNIPACYSTISGGWGSESLKDLGAATPSEVLPSVHTSQDLFNDVVWGLIFNTSMDFGTKGTGGGPLVHGHEYSVVSARVLNGVNQIEVRNPWGYNPGYVSGSSTYNSTNDGYMWVNASAVFGELDEFVTASL
ncbi:MAG TPA: C2 family cysteine protease [Humisphaera sp.]|jgi:hypothetical protein|nr:C2 family cysteine protease [Humisphaera sp.]